MLGGEWKDESGEECLQNEAGDEGRGVCSPAKKAESDFWRFSAQENQKIREKNPLTNTSNKKLGHGYLYFKPCSAKQEDEMTSCGSIAVVELVLVPT